MRGSELRVWDRQRDRGADGTQHCLMPPMGAGHNNSDVITVINVLAYRDIGHYRRLKCRKSLTFINLMVDTLVRLLALTLTNTNRTNITPNHKP